MKRTVTYRGIDFVVDFDYQPEERAVMYYPDGSGYPGYPPAIEINTIYHGDTDFTEYFFMYEGGDARDIEDLIWESLKKDEEDY